jgi:lysophospholipase L1-like esterase
LKKQGAQPAKARSTPDLCCEVDLFIPEDYQYIFLMWLGRNPMALSLREPAGVASPRTLWSAYNKREVSTWHTCHDELVADAQRYSASTGESSRRLVLFGDSITESWRGTSYGRKVARTKGVPQVLNATLGVRYKEILPLGIAADCTQHLLWRIIHGELTAPMAADPLLTIVLLIGTNNLGRGHTIDETYGGILAVATHLLNTTRARLLVNAILPRGDKHKKGKRKGRSFVSEVLAVNERLSTSLDQALGRAYPMRARVVDCGAPYYTEGFSVEAALKAHAAGVARGRPPTRSDREEIVRRELMPDRLHPNAQGHLLWGHCLLTALHAWGA